MEATDTFTDVFARASETMRTVLPAVRVPSIRACQLIGAAPAPRFIVSYMDLRAVPAIEKWPQWSTRCLGKSDRGNHVFMWFHHGPDGVSVTTAHPDTAVARNNVTAYVDRVRQVMTAVAAAGRYDVCPSPSPTTVSPPGSLHESMPHEKASAGPDAVNAVRNSRETGGKP